MSRCPLGASSGRLSSLEGDSHEVRMYIIRVHPRKVGSQRAVSERLEVR
jgi:hypothetical protein